MKQKASPMLLYFLFNYLNKAKYNNNVKQSCENSSNKQDIFNAYKF